MSYQPFNVGDLVRFNRKKYNSYSTIRADKEYYVVELQGSKIGLSLSRDGTPINWYNASNFELVKAAFDDLPSKSSTFDQSHVLITDGTKGNIITRCDLSDVQDRLRSLLKKNPEGSYIVYAPQFEARYPELPIEMIPITIKVSEATEEEQRVPTKVLPVSSIELTSRVFRAGV